MSVSISGAAGVGYYTGGVATPEATRNYYTGAVRQGEPPGRWSGALAARLGLKGEVDARAMEALFDRFEAPDGTTLGQPVSKPRPIEAKMEAWDKAHPDALPEDRAAALRQMEAGARPTLHGMDLTFSPPKSVTVAHTALWRAETEAFEAGDLEAGSKFRAQREGIEAALWRANEAALAHAASVAVARAGGGAGRAQHLVRVDGLAVASFHQHTTRPSRGDERQSIDPQQHIHNVVLNRADTDDGRVRAPWSTEMIRQRSGISAVADRVLAEEMERIGLPMAVRPDGKAREVLGIEDDVMALFSERRRVISERLTPWVERAEERLGRPLTDLEAQRLSRQVTLFSRSSKTGGEGDFERHLDAWQERMTDELGRGLTPLAHRLSRQMSTAERDAPEGRSFSPSAIRAMAMEAAQDAAGRSATWNKAHLMAHLDRVLPVNPDLSPAESTRLLSQLADEAIAEHAVQVAGKDSLPSVDGQFGLGFITDGQRKYAAPTTIEGEQRIRDAAVIRGGHSIDPKAVDAWLSEHAPSIGADQREVVKGLAGSDARLAMLVAGAGTGKSFTTGSLSGAWEALSDGGRVMGLTVSQQAAEVLKGEGVQASNVAAFMAAQQRIAEGRPLDADQDKVIGSRDILVVDEASMVSSADLDALRALAEASGARLVLSGDPRQLGAVEAGGVMELLDGRAETYSLSEVRRFEDQWQADASVGLREGDLEALAEYDRRGRLLDYADSSEAVSAAARAAAADILAGKDTLVVAGTNAEADALSAMIREHLQLAGRVAEGGVHLGRDGNEAGVGDRLMTRQNNYELGVLNRGRYTIAEVLDNGGVRLADENGEERVLPPEYVAENAQLGYASTVHAAQGMTVDRAHFLTDGRTDASALYVGLTRGRERNTVHVALRGQDGMESGNVQVEPGENRSAYSVLRGALEQERETASAIVSQELDDARERGMEFLLSQRETLVEQATRVRLEGHLDEMAAEGVLSEADRARLAAEQGMGHLNQLLRAVEQAGLDPKETLREAIASHELSSAASVSQVLSHRITSRHDVSVAAPEPTLPEGLSGPLADRLQAVEERVDDRVRVLGAEVAQGRPVWALTALGGVPEDEAARKEWEARAGRVAAYREASGFSDGRRALPGAPGITQTEARGSWWSAWEALGRPESTREEASLRDGQLQSRIAAWEREQQWAPAHADASLRQAEQDAERLRTEAILAASRGEDATEIEQEAERRAAVARGMGSVAEGRAAWAADTAETRAAAERAKEELESRGILHGQEEDRMTVEDWREHEAAQREREEAEMVIDERDIEDPAIEELRAMDDDRQVEVEEPEVQVEKEIEAPEPEREPPARTEAPVSPSVVELEAHVAAAQAAADRVADRQSEEDAHLSWEVEQEIAPERDAQEAILERSDEPDW